MRKIRIYLGKHYKETSSGPQMFLSRLVKALTNYPVEFTSRKPHISFGVIVALPYRKARQVVRIDGCYYNKAMSGCGSMNRRIAESIKKADGVVYQSSFSKTLCERILKVKARKDTIIYNAIDQNWVNSIEPLNLPSENSVVAVANWRNSKRPKSIINGFLEAKIPNSKLFFLGKFKKKIEHEDLVFLGNVSSSDIIAHLKSAKALVHLCKIESCPNVAIEALSCGVPVVCNNIGGTQEIVGSDGVIVKCDPEFKFEYIDQGDVDNLDPKLIANGIKECFSKTWTVNRPDLDINRAAKEYYDFFYRVVEGR